MTFVAPPLRSFCKCPQHFVRPFVDHSNRSVAQRGQFVQHNVNGVRGGNTAGRLGLRGQFLEHKSERSGSAGFEAEVVVIRVEEIAHDEGLLGGRLTADGTPDENMVDHYDRRRLGVQGTGGQSI